MKKILSMITLLTLISCGRQYDIVHNENIENKTPIEVIDPCGASEFDQDEVILRFSDTQLYVYFSSGEKEYNSLLHVGSYVTTDKQACRFDVIEVAGRLEIQEVE